GQAVGAQPVQGRIRRAATRSAGQLGVAPPGDGEPARPSLDAGLLVDPAVGRLDVALVVVAAGTAAAQADGHVDPARLVGPVVVVTVVLAGQGQVAADVGDHRLTDRLRPFQGGVAAADQGQGVAGLDSGFGVGRAAAFAIAAGGVGADVHADARLGAHGDADLAAAGAVAGIHCVRLLGALQDQVAGRGQGDVVAFDLAAGHAQVSAAGDDRYIAFTGDAAAGDRGLLVVRFPAGAAGADADAQAQAAVAAGLCLLACAGQIADLLAGVGQVVQAGLAAGEQGLSGPGRLQRLEAGAPDLVGAAGGAVHGRGRVPRAAPQADVDPALLEALALGHQQGVLDVGDGDVLATDGNALAA